MIPEESSKETFERESIVARKDDARDAARYRWIRYNMPAGTLADIDVSSAESWDAAIDAARGKP